MACDLTLSVLDTSPIVEGSSAAEALHRTLDLARLADRTGFHRYWVPEHHGMRGVACAEPAVLAGAIASATSGLRVGAGGVLLPNHPPLLVAERWGMLAALHPGRIDLGIGRAPGGTPAMAAALRRPPEATTAPAHATALGELLACFEPESRAVPARGNRPEIWLLGSSGTGARLAAEHGLPCAHAHHLDPEGVPEAARVYRESFRPSAQLAEPVTLVSVAVICAESDAEAERLAGSTRWKTLSRRRGRRILLPSPERAAAELAGLDRAEVESCSPGLVAGSPGTVRRELLAIAARTGSTELMITTPVHDHARRRRSYELLADAVHPARPR
ncbi:MULTISPECIES: LLM class flavin-dependent oxidoreductase [unclassified Saccharopolyspora]|uniref:LLM class flavin-dependent oxidoreductase n=1 Tax=unclassified Saccharopolyspora TaxID=2646250 RepID=UPI001CD44E81|nr:MULTISPECIES: LLM class flavin-dependent oxidoreductase [unclassified Saccharopolyspora]MCA1186731.1 LLM class flavin-dependent oxidoreductase [Saccharopolyspora sp. 6T]MCA1226607.1 LLM class flavin-dependent oxidoreductase [Saccharopolyspora sp. 6M]MCA1278328.1 LLM class flavin-dependent oxidoreductase [Saccharopolyspora sp. 7B]